MRLEDRCLSLKSSAWITVGCDPNPTSCLRLDRRVGDVNASPESAATSSGVTLAKSRDCTHPPRSPRGLHKWPLAAFRRMR